MLGIATTEIGPDERTPDLAKRLAIIGAEAMVRALRNVERGVAVETPQDHARATFAAKLDKAEGEVRFEERAAALYDRFRAFDPWPGLFTVVGGETIKLTDVRPVNLSGKPRSVLSIGDDIVIACGDGALRVIEMQRPGKPRSAAGAIARGLGWRVGEVLP
jgi:methionyl-tRNA formyltransferase